MSAYSVTKAGVVKLSEVLDMELAPHNVSISVVCPAFFPTNLAESFRTTTPGMEKSIQKAFARSPITCEQVAFEVFKTIDNPRFWVLPHRKERVLWWLKLYLPQSWYKRLLAALLRLFDRLYGRK